MAEIVRYVDPNSSGGNGTTTALSGANAAYASLNAWEAAENADLDTANNWMHVYCRSDGATNADTTAVVITGWTTSADDYILIETHADYRHAGTFDTDKYYIHNNDANAQQVAIYENYVRFDYIQVQVTETSINGRIGLYFVLQDAADVLYVSNSIFRGVCSGTGAGEGIKFNDADITAYLWNNIIYDFFISGDAGFRGINVIDCTNVYIYNCTINNCYIGIFRGAGTVTVQNTLVFECTDDFYGTISATYCASDDLQAGTGNFQITQTADDYAALVTDADGGNFTVTDASSELYNTGDGATPKGTFTDDIIGTTRGPADGDWDIGAFEYVAAAGGLSIPRPLSRPLAGPLGGI